MSMYDFRKDRFRNRWREGLQAITHLNDSWNIVLKTFKTYEESKLQFKEDVFHRSLEKLNEKVDIIITDLPYWNIVNWIGAPNDISDILRILNQVLRKNWIMIVVSNKKVKLTSSKFKRRLSSKHGKRYVYIFQRI